MVLVAVQFLVLKEGMDRRRGLMRKASCSVDARRESVGAVVEHELCIVVGM